MELLDYIKTHAEWEKELALPPYCLSIHRDNGLIIFKYGLGSDFNISLVREARGIIFEEATWNVVCRGFDKFGNYGEAYCSEIDWSTASVQEKIDGSLIKLYYYNGEWKIATNGTINAYNANLPEFSLGSFGDFVYRLIDKKVGWNYIKTFCRVDTTYMFEFVSKYARVVIPYDEDNIYYLGARRNEDGLEFFPEETFLAEKFKMPKRFPMTSVDEVIKAANALDWKQEGFVVCDGQFNRVKIKSPQYLVVHFARKNNTITYKHILEVYLNGDIEEFRHYAEDYEDMINTVQEAKDKLEVALYNAIIAANTLKEGKNKKEFALEVQQYFPSNVRGIMFKNYDTSCSVQEYTKEWTPNKWLQELESYINKKSV